MESSISLPQVLSPVPELLGYVRLGNGDGTFRALTTTSTNTSGNGFLTTGDVNGDGILDVVTSGGGATSILIGNGNGSFQAARTSLNPAAGGRIDIADINNDGFADIISGGGAILSLQLGNGSGTFGAAISQSVSPGYQGLSDLNGDGNLDLIFLSAVRLGNGQGGFSSDTNFAYTFQSAFPERTVTADLNGDGIQDLILAAYDPYDDRGINVLLGRGDGTFENPRSLITDNIFFASVAVGDVNRDGVPDFVAAFGFGTSEILTFQNQISDGVSPLLPFSLDSVANARQAMSMLDYTLENLTEQRGMIGSYQSRLSSALSTLRSSSDNFAQAASRITDVDVATESARLIRLQIARDAGAAILGQANFQTQLALTLLNPS